MRSEVSLSQRFESLFWHAAIPILSSGSSLVRKVVNLGYSTSSVLSQKNMAAKIIFWSSVGFSIGLGLGMLFAKLS